MKLYDGMTIADWDVPFEATDCPNDPAERAKWGWLQDENGRWYREVANDESIALPPDASPSSMNPPGNK